MKVCNEYIYINTIKLRKRYDHKAPKYTLNNEYITY